jgi:hypothetical protein
MSEPAWERNDTKLLFEVLFDLKSLLAKIVALIESGDDDGMEEEEAE